MPDSLTSSEEEFYNRLKWLMFFRVIFTSLLLGSTIVLQIGQRPPPVGRPIPVLYGMIAGIFLLSFVYTLALQRVRNLQRLAYVQITIDTFVVTLIIFVTGSYSSIFSFLYLVVITYSSLFLLRYGSMIMAACCTIQYGIMINLEFYGLLKPYLMEGELSAVNYPWSHVLYKLMIIMVACFAVAFLSGVLAEQVRKTTSELEAMEDHVKRVEKMAYMGKMAANMAHEIKNPLASLAGSIQLLREDIPYDPDRDKLMKIVLRETDRLSELVNNFLMFARPSRGKVEAFEVGAALSETIALFEKDDNCRERIHISKDLTSDVWIEMDPLHFRQVLWNLFLNAAEAIQNTGRIHIVSDRSGLELAVIRISDDGCGMSPDMVSSIFDPFFTTKPNGTGLGLSIVHSILESYGSRLHVESEIGEGTLVTMKFRMISRPT